MKRHVDVELTEKQFEKLKDEIDVWCYKSPEDLLLDEIYDIQQYQTQGSATKTLCNIILNGSDFLEELMSRTAVLKVDGNVLYVRSTPDLDVLDVVKDMYYPEMSDKEFYSSNNKEVIDDGLPERTKEEKIKIDLGHSVLAVECGQGDSSSELIVSLEDHDGVWQQDLVMIGSQYHFDKDDKMVNDKGIKLRVWADKYNEDYSDSFEIGIYEEKENEKESEREF